MPFGGYAALDTASAPRRVWLLPTAIDRSDQSGLPERFDSCQAPHSFISILRRRQVVDKWCRYGGLIEPIFVVTRFRPGRTTAAVAACSRATCYSLSLSLVRTQDCHGVDP